MSSGQRQLIQVGLTPDLSPWSPLSGSLTGSFTNLKAQTPNNGIWEIVVPLLEKSCPSHHVHAAACKETAHAPPQPAFRRFQRASLNAIGRELLQVP